MDKKVFDILRALFWIIISVTLAVCDFIKGGVVYTIFGCIFIVVSVVWVYLLTEYLDE